MVSQLRYSICLYFFKPFMFTFKILKVTLVYFFEQARVIFLGDNNPGAQYNYHVTIFTGLRRVAGTTAVATITLYGAAGSSEPHVLTTEGKRKILQRGGVDSFVLSTHGSLEDLTAVRVWHDNSGKHPEW